MYVQARFVSIFIFTLLFYCCTSSQGEKANKIEDTSSLQPVKPIDISAHDSLSDTTISIKRADTIQQTLSTARPPIQLHEIPDSGFVELIRLDSSFILDLRYATPNNFLKEKVYDCAKCLLRKEAAMALIKAQYILLAKGYRLRLFDCYRPLDVQKKMWKIMPNDHFVGNPYGNGSMHNKGAALDLTLADSTGKELDMGTPFDFFGKEAYHAYTKLPADVLQRRQLLKQTMIQVGFSPITSEWWHYSYKGKRYKVANFKPDCE
ncbi:M15 family metallopeptidase [Cytophagaceae bacterium YF14B1]|uniref:D-alanyl-D-alanine dipeptidase n=1 Tax=Xanthocytophaga flava TaxID=3048013 RepID=A0AAE3QL79_9BACT|nr:M15 family metallopeptidase [Xanthocytophaga flavus]MDJ1481402.1 M15 family metallopeptidase [Xanthocytophaga flavus]